MTLWLRARNSDRVNSDHGLGCALCEHGEKIVLLQRDATDRWAELAVSELACAVQKNRAAKPCDRRRVVVANDSEHVVEIVVAPHFLGTCLVGKGDKAV